MAAFKAGQVSTVFPTAPAGSLFYGDPGVPGNFTSNSPYQFAPNIGFALDPRAMERPSSPLASNTRTTTPTSTPVTATRRIRPSRPTYSKPRAPHRTYQPYQSLVYWTCAGSPYPAPYPPTATSAKFYGQSQWVALPSDFHPPQTLQYTASMQHSFAHDWQMQLHYIGSNTNRLPLGVPLNRINFIPGVWGANGTGCAGVVLYRPRRCEARCRRNALLHHREHRFPR